MAASDDGDRFIGERMGGGERAPRDNYPDPPDLREPWPFGGRPRDGALPAPAPEVVMAANGVYWRRYEDSLSMVPVSDDNDPVLSPLAVYRLVGWEDHDGTFHEVPDAG